MAAKEAANPLRRVLLACDESFGAEDVRGRIESARERVNANDMRGFVIPVAIFAPIAGADFFPRVVKLLSRGVELHRRR